MLERAVVFEFEVQEEYGDLRLMSAVHVISHQWG